MQTRRAIVIAAAVAAAAGSARVVIEGAQAAPAGNVTNGEGGIREVRLRRVPRPTGRR